MSSLFYKTVINSTLFLKIYNYIVHMYLYSRMVDMLKQIVESVSMHIYCISYPKNEANIPRDKKAVNSSAVMPK